MDLVTARSSEMGLESLGQLVFSSRWTSAHGREEIEHFVETLAIRVVPRSVLYWDHEPDRKNSTKRFRHMLGLRAFAELGSVDSYSNSLLEAADRAAIEHPSEKRMGTLALLADRYMQSPPGWPVTCLRTSTARIIFRFNPPEGSDLSNIHDFLESRAESS